MSTIFKIYNLQRELEEINKNLSKVESQIAELKEALKWIKELHPKAVYKTFADRIAIELPPDNVEDIVQKEIERLEKVKNFLISRREEILKKI